MKFRVLLVVVALLMSVTSLAAQETECGDDARLIVHDLGETCVPNNVERVVTIEHSMTEAVVTLGVQPVGVTEIELYNALVNLSIPLSEDAVDVGSRRAPNLEVITTLNPDLIIAASWRVSEIYEELSAIAPTITFEGSSNLETLEEFFTTIAFALGREEAVEEIIAIMYQHFEDAAAIVVDADVVTDFVLSQTWQVENLATFRLFDNSSMAVEILESIGFENAWDAEPTIDGYSTVGIESLGDIRDVSFLYITDPDSEAFYEESPLWNSLAFVQDGAAYRLNDDLWLYGGPLSAQRFVDAVLETLGLIEVEAEVVEPTAEAEAGS